MSVCLIEDKKVTPLLLTDDKGYPVPYPFSIENPPIFDHMDISFISEYGTLQSRFENIVKPFVDFLLLMVDELPRKQTVENKQPDNKEPMDEVRDIDNSSLYQGNMVSFTMIKSRKQKGDDCD